MQVIQTWRWLIIATRHDKWQRIQTIHGRRGPWLVDRTVCQSPITNFDADGMIVLKCQGLDECQKKKYILYIIMYIYI